MRIQQPRPTTKTSAAQQTAPTKQTMTPSKPTATGWGPRATPASQARALAAYLKSPEGAKQAARIIETVAKRNDLAKELNWEAGHLKGVKPYENGKFLVDVQLDVLTEKGGVQKHYFGAIVNAQGKVLDVPQG
jgi:hypothetical protein